MALGVSVASIFCINVLILLLLEARLKKDSVSGVAGGR